MPRAAGVADATLRHLDHQRFRMALLLLRAYDTHRDGLDTVAETVSDHLTPHAAATPTLIADAIATIGNNLPRWAAEAVASELRTIDEPADGPWTAERLIARLWAARHLDTVAAATAPTYLPFLAPVHEPFVIEPLVAEPLLLAEPVGA